MSKQITCEETKLSGFKCNYKAKFIRGDGKQVCGFHNKPKTEFQSEMKSETQSEMKNETQAEMKSDSQKLRMVRRS